MSKKIVSLILVFTLLISVGTVALLTTGAQNSEYDTIINFDGKKYGADEGDTVTVTVSAKYADPLANYQGWLNFDDSVLVPMDEDYFEDYYEDLVPVISGRATYGTMMYTYTSDTPAEALFVWTMASRAPSFANGGDLFICVFTAAKGETDLTNYVELMSALPNGQPLVTVIKNNEVIVQGLDFEVTISGVHEIITPTTEEPTTVEPTTEEPTTEEPTTVEPTTEEPTTGEPTTAEPTTEEPTTEPTEEPTTAEPTTEPTEEPSTSAPVADGYYMVGYLNGQNLWTVDSLTEDRLLNVGTTTSEYTLDWTFTENDEIKVVKVENGQITAWYNDGGENYKISGEEVGDSTVHFNPDGNPAWTYNYIYVESKSQPTTTEEPTTEEPTTEPTEEPTTEEPTTEPTEEPTTEPTTEEPTTEPTEEPTTAEPTTEPTEEPTTAEPTTAEPTTAEPTTAEPTTAEPTTAEPTTAEPTTAEPTTAEPTTSAPTTVAPTTIAPTTVAPTTETDTITVFFKPSEEWSGATSVVVTSPDGSTTTIPMKDAGKDADGKPLVSAEIPADATSVYFVSEGGDISENVPAVYLHNGVAFMNSEKNADGIWELKAFDPNVEPSTTPGSSTDDEKKNNDPTNVKTGSSSAALFVLTILIMAIGVVIFARKKSSIK